MISFNRARAPGCPGWSKQGPLDPVPRTQRGLTRRSRAENVGEGSVGVLVRNWLERRSSLARVLMRDPYSMDSRSSVVPELSGQTRDVISNKKGGRTPRKERAVRTRGAHYPRLAQRPFIRTPSRLENTLGTTERANGRRGRREQCDPETRTTPASRSVR